MSSKHYQPNNKDQLIPQQEISLQMAVLKMGKRQQHTQKTKKTKKKIKNTRAVTKGNYTGTRKQFPRIMPAGKSTVDEECQIEVIVHKNNKFIKDQSESDETEVLAYQIP